MNGLVGWLSLGLMVLANVIAFVWSAAKVSSALVHLHEGMKELKQTDKEVQRDLRDMHARLRVVESTEKGA